MRIDVQRQLKEEFPPINLIKEIDRGKYRFGLAIDCPIPLTWKIEIFKMNNVFWSQMVQKTRRPYYASFFGSRGSRAKKRRQKFDRKEEWTNDMGCLELKMIDTGRLPNEVRILEQTVTPSLVT